MDYHWSRGRRHCGTCDSSRCCAMVGAQAEEEQKGHYHFNSELELREADQGVHLHVQCAQSGPLVENGTHGAAEQEKEVAGVIPFYAVLYKSKKSKKQADEKHPEFITKPPVPLYANAGDFQKPGIATVSISPQPLPAIKEAYPYERMDYADITYLPKGNATLPPNDRNGDGNETETSKQKQGSRRD
ncbi:PREDICTED: uncharacterized protein LOC107350706 [Acropora digitifera]|uniref:uncharacterized protein LOC107350706 n=1 Tax=Acropora digitifera TaxID=70779 RepID=UPI00077AA33F|nr:PREDICTED: uncharacterized protein LOC107350706 [Acropora digitifera]